MIPGGDETPGIVLCHHASLQMAERRIDWAWVVSTLTDPEFVRPDLRDLVLKLAFRQIPEAGSRWLRAVYKECQDGKYVITLFLDRKAERRR
ncbi:MAG: hypothetical protein JWL93_1929 [Hyphomicrobiales bacterium]|nr:hypothetical protein [Hyphomicrobiales bacterium]